MKLYYPIEELVNLAPHPVFLAGSIEMGNVEDWQKEAYDCISERLDHDKFCVLNPRRKDWDSSWKQCKADPDFRGQVEWEMKGLGLSKTIIMYLHPDTRAPISLLELGLHASSGKLLVVCPDGYWRKGNVDIVCEHYHIPQFDSVDSAIEYILQTHGNNISLSRSSVTSLPGELATSVIPSSRWWI